MIEFKNQRMSKRGQNCSCHRTPSHSTVWTPHKDHGRKRTSDCTAIAAQIRKKVYGLQKSISLDSPGPFTPDSLVVAHCFNHISCCLRKQRSSCSMEHGFEPFVEFDSPSLFLILQQCSSTMIQTRPATTTFCCTNARYLAKSWCRAPIR